jgi:hypothetical protein
MVKKSDMSIEVEGRHEGFVQISEEGKNQSIRGFQKDYEIRKEKDL